MSSRGETREQPSTRDPGALRAEHFFLIVAAVSLSAACAAYVLDAELPIDLNRGAYSIMVALFVAGYCGWLSRSAERRMRRVAVAELQRLSAAVEELGDEVARSRVTYLPPTAKRTEAHRALYAAAGGDTVSVGPPRTGLDPETIAAARALARRIADGAEVDDQQS